MFNTVSVIGLGYIGLPTAAVFASRKKRVIGVDVNDEAVQIINRGEIHIVEPDLDMVVHAAVTEGYLKATTKPEPADAFGQPLDRVEQPLRRPPSEVLQVHVDAGQLRPGARREELPVVVADHGDVAGDGDAGTLDRIGGWLDRVTDANRCFLGTQELLVVGSILAAFPDDVRAHLDGACPGHRDLQVPRLADLDGGRIVLAPARP